MLQFPKALAAVQLLPDLVTFVVSLHLWARVIKGTRKEQEQSRWQPDADLCLWKVLVEVGQEHAAQHCTASERA